VVAKLIQSAILNPVTPATKNLIWVKIIGEGKSAFDKDNFDQSLLGNYRVGEAGSDSDTLTLFDPDIAYISESLKQFFKADNNGIGIDIIEGLANLMFSERINIESTEKIVSGLCNLVHDTNSEEQVLRKVRSIYLQASRSDQIVDSELLIERLTPLMDDDPKIFVNNLARIWRRYNNPTFKEIPEEILEKLSPHTFEVISEKPKSFVIANSDKRQIFHAVLDVRRPKNRDGESDDEEGGMPTLKFRDIVINAVPTKIIKYENPASFDIKYEIEFETPLGHKFKTAPLGLDQITAELKTKGLIYKIRSADEALPAILNAYDRDGKITVKNEIDTQGFYLVDGKIVPIKVDIKMPSKEKIIQCVAVLEQLSTMLKHQDRFATYMKWGIASPFSFVMKQLDDEQFWLPLLFLDGFTRVGKTTDGVIILAINRKHTHKDRRKHNIGFASMDNVARFGLAGSYDTYPVLVNEVEFNNLRDPKTKSLVESIKHAVQNETSRSRFGKNKTTAEHFSALSSFIFTSNDNPPDDAAFLGRTVRIHYIKEDKPTEAERKAFDKFLYKERHIDNLGTLGDYTASYILEHQDLIHEDWKSWTEKILTEFYKEADKEVPEWIKQFVPETQLEDIIMEQEQSIRAFFERAINDTYKSNFNTYTSYNTSGRENVTFADRMKFCLDKELIPYLRKKERGGFGQPDDVLILHDVMKEMQKNGLNHAHGLKELAGIIGGIYDDPKIDNKTVRVIRISETKLKDFILPDLDLLE
jgi:hypothetical protein